ncbi:MAG: hypothetical protein ABSG73_11350 [Candidatus Aminicenantales bacterium]
MTRKWIVYPLIAAAVAALGAAGLAKDTVVASQWAAGPVKIDGLDQDWQDATFLTDPASKAQYAVKNDGKNLYVLFLFKDPAAASTIEYTGMKVFLNAEGKKSKDFGVHFTKKEVTAEALISSLEKTGEVLTDERKAELRKQGVFHMFEADVINAKKAAAPADPTVKTDPPAYRSARNQRVLCWELRIPLSRVNQPGGLGSEPGQMVKMGFEWGGMTSQVMKEMMAGMSSQGGTSRQGAGVTGSVGTPRDETAREEDTGIESSFKYQRDPRTRLHSFWIDLKLAAQ